MDVKDKKVIVAGLGLSGVASCKVLSNMGATINVYDSKNESELKETIKKLDNLNIKYYLNRLEDDIFDNVVLEIVSPGIPVDSLIVKGAKQRGIDVISEVEFAFNLSKAPIYAITGTNGKTTTTALLGEMFLNFGKKTYIAGNIGYPLVEASIKANIDDIIVAEISSFQLETIKKFRPKISAIINITPDHLDRHKTLENYIDIKGRIFENQTYDDYTVLNYDDLNVKKIFNRPKCKVFPFSMKKTLETGTYVKDNKIVISFKGKNYNIIDINDIYIPGWHNVENSIVASSIAFLAGIKVDVINKTLKTFKGVEHRIEYVKTINDVKYYNDSKGTNPDASIKAIEAMKGQVTLIAGGYDKGVGFDTFTEAFKGKVKKLILLGVTAKKIYESALKNGFSKENIYFVDNLNEAVDLAYDISSPGDNVLLSPACASWDMFDNFEERGKLFKERVNSLRG